MGKSTRTLGEKSVFQLPTLFELAVKILSSYSSRNVAVSVNGLRCSPASVPCAYPAGAGAEVDAEDEEVEDEEVDTDEDDEPLDEAADWLAELSAATVDLLPKRDRLKPIKVTQRPLQYIPYDMKATFAILAKLFLHIFMAKCREYLV